LITILIGTNDVHASMSPENYAGYVQMGKTNQPVNFDTFKENIDALISRLQSETAAHIALVSIPLISENLTHAVNQRGDQYSDYLRQAAEHHKVDYLPLRETQKAFLEGKPAQSGPPYENSTNLIGAAFVYKSLGFGWDKIAAYHGNQLSIDNLHSNSVTANMIADLIQGFIQKYTSSVI
jgi:lysophospholipase L1-like esterase